MPRNESKLANLALRVKLCFHLRMRKSDAIDLFGDMPGLAAAVGVTYQAVRQWPDPLPARIADRVIAAGLRAGKCAQQLRCLAGRSPS